MDKFETYFQVRVLRLKFVPESLAQITRVYMCQQKTCFCNLDSPDSSSHLWWTSCWYCCIALWILYLTWKIQQNNMQTTKADNGSSPITGRIQVKYRLCVLACISCYICGSAVNQWDLNFWQMVLKGIWGVVMFLSSYESSGVIWREHITSGCVKEPSQMWSI